MFRHQSSRILEIFFHSQDPTRLWTFWRLSSDLPNLVSTGSSPWMAWVMSKWALIENHVLLCLLSTVWRWIPRTGRPLDIWDHRLWMKKGSQMESQGWLKDARLRRAELEGRGTEEPLGNKERWMRITEAIKMCLRSMTILPHPKSWYISDIRRQLGLTTVTTNIHFPSAGN